MRAAVALAAFLGGVVGKGIVFAATGSRKALGVYAVLRLQGLNHGGRTEGGEIPVVAANAAMVYRVYAGMTFLPGGIEFNPTIPSFMKGIKHIYGFKYRNATLDITISGTGNDIDNISIDNQVGHDNFFSGQLSGHHTIHIKMRNSTPVAQEVTLGDQNFTLPATPVVKWLKDSTRILNYNSNLDYRMVVNGQLLYTVNDSMTLRHTTAGTRFTVSAIAGVGRYALRYLSKPYMKVSASLQLPLPLTLMSKRFN